jgi:hypothetical protein
MYVIRRFISSYDGEDIFIGVFQDEGIAEDVRKEYIRSCQKDDMWKVQTYRQANLEKDVVVVKYACPGEDALASDQTVFLVFEYSSGFGQDCKVLKQIFADRPSAEACAKELEKTSKEGDEWPSEFIVEEDALNTPHF